MIIISLFRISYTCLSAINIKHTLAQYTIIFTTFDQSKTSCSILFLSKHLHIIFIESIEEKCIYFFLLFGTYITVNSRTTVVVVDPLLPDYWGESASVV